MRRLREPSAEPVRSIITKVTASLAPRPYKKRGAGVASWGHSEGRVQPQTNFSRLPRARLALRISPFCAQRGRQTVCNKKAGNRLRRPGPIVHGLTEGRTAGRPLWLRPHGQLRPCAVVAQRLYLQRPSMSPSVAAPRPRMTAPRARGR